MTIKAKASTQHAQPAVLDKSWTDKFIRMDYDTPFNDIGMRIRYRYLNIPIDMLLEEKLYQRPYEKKRLKIIEESVVESGEAWPTTLMEINMRFGTLDGNHRRFIFMDLGITTVPEVIQLEFKTLEDEVNYFVKKNTHGSTIKKPPIIWAAKHLAKHTTAQLLYKLVTEDKESKLYNYVALMHEPSTINRLSIAQAWQIIAKVGLNRLVKYERVLDSYLESLIQTTAYDVIKARINHFMDWFVACFGEKKEKHASYNAKTMVSYIIAYKMLLDAKLINNKKSYNASTKKFGKLVLAPETLSCEPFVIATAILSHYNLTIKNPNNMAPFPVKRPLSLK